MNEHRALLMEAFKRGFVPGLRARGFKGSFPNFHRPSATRVDYLMVQFSSSGGRFVLEVGRSGPDGIDDEPWRNKPVSELNPAYMGSLDRQRLKPTRKQYNDGGWWRFGPRSGDPQPVKPQAFYDAVAEDALAAFVDQGEPWFGSAPPGRPDPKPPQGPPPWPLSPLFGGRFTHLVPGNGPRLRIACLLSDSGPRLARWETMRALVEPMSALIGRLPQSTWITSYQSRLDGGGWLPFGPLPWSEKSNREWTTKYMEADPGIWLDRTEFWSPSRSAWAKNIRKPPALYARIEDDEDGRQGFLLALRYDQLPAAAQAADTVIEAVARLLPDARRMLFNRVWCESPHLFGLLQGEPLDHTKAEDVAAWGEARPHLQVASFSARGR